MILLLLVSCKGFLDLEPKSEATDENFWKSQDDAKSAVAGMYALLRVALNGGYGIAHYAYGDLASDEVNSANVDPYHHIVNMNLNLSLASSNTGNAVYLLRRYDDFYKVIDQANRVIKHLNQMENSFFDSEKTKKYFIGEAYFIRSFTYFYLGRIWGGVPILTEATSPIYAVNHESATAEKVMEQSLNDLQEAKKYLDWRNLVNTDFAVRANKGAVFALEAHIGAWTGNYNSTIAAADSIINSEMYFYVSRDSLAYKTIFNGKSSEGIFEISQSATNEGTSVGIGTFTLASPKYHRTISSPRLVTSKTRIDELYNDRNDKRRKFTMDTTINSTFVICNKYSNISYPEEGNNAVPVFKNNIIIFRYSDIVLLKAEALAATNKSSQAIQVLDEVRMMSGLAPWSGNGTLMKAIFDERARELFMEAHRFYDMVRLYRHHGIFEFPASRMTQEQFNRGKYMWPFDPSLLNQNPLLKQTPYWATVGF
ncbi:RagB/SusD family nutrient uptake outer membrane protein [Sphingobacterium bovistauri]|uniref:RagB/SusD family nutrient uptake outer membrane protein n=1 Tax=Sphingobacterium bovistauri TaxID=2781959 RepID=A0ABS7Z122_9SPHI|nr:RagB/SusD family nutrient uptake outer membrane protein [Sphingobacterium bovistauri]MCA5003826.1 RagB/SusD family nutrient uptake outer membrane protein [Sphingobacterium bovistauri]